MHLNKYSIDDLESELLKIVTAYQNLDNIVAQALAVGSLDANGPFFDTIWRTFKTMLDSVENALDSGTWISWYLYDNECGRSNLAAANNGQPLRPVSSLRDLATLIYTETENESV